MDLIEVACEVVVMKLLASTIKFLDNSVNISSSK
jgi:hypothetical protein